MAIASLEHFADKYFCGDKDAALKRLAREVYSCKLELAGTRDEVYDIIDSMEEDEAELYKKYLAEEMEKVPAWKKPYKKISLRLRLLNMEYKDFDKKSIPKRNPYLIKTLVFLAIFFFACAAISFYRDNPQIFTKEDYPKLHEGYKIKLYDRFNILLKLIADVGLFGGLFNAWRIYLYEITQKLITTKTFVPVDEAPDDNTRTEPLEDSSLPTLQMYGDAEEEPSTEDGEATVAL